MWNLTEDLKISIVSLFVFIVHTVVWSHFFCDLQECHLSTLKRVTGSGNEHGKWENINMPKKKRRKEREWEMSNRVNDTARVQVKFCSHFSFSRSLFLVLVTSDLQLLRYKAVIRITCQWRRLSCFINLVYVLLSVKTRTQ